MTDSLGRPSYGQTKWGYAHRVSYELFVGPIPQDKIICHRCDRKACVEPSHLYAGAARDNGRDRAERSEDEFLVLQDSCGHGYDLHEVALTSEQRCRVERAAPVMAVEPDQVITNPDLWSEEDERSLMVLGFMDGHEPKSVRVRTLHAYNPTALGRDPTYRPPSESFWTKRRPA